MYVRSAVYSQNVSESRPAEREELLPSLLRHSCYDAYQSEIELLLTCSRTSLDSKTSALLEQLLKRDLDWVFIIKNAQINGITPLLCHTLLTEYSEYIPEKYLEWLKGFSKEHTRNNLFQTMELVRVVRLLDLNNMPTLPLKGPTLAALAYRDLSLRQFCDLDIMVQKKDIQGAIQLLSKNGYQLSSPPSWFERLPTVASRKKDFALVNSNKSVRIELHWRFSGTHFDLPLHLKTTWGSLKSVPFAGYSVRSLPINDLLLYLTMHGSRHGWMRLAWVCDIAELVRAHEDIDWKLLWKQACTTGCERTLGLGLLLAHSLLRAPLPLDVLDKIQADTALTTLAFQVCSTLFGETASPHSIAYWNKYHFAMKERLQDRLRVRLHYYYRYAHLAIAPNTKDYALVPLPRHFRFLYYVLRPFRLIWEQGYKRVFKFSRK